MGGYVDRCLYMGELQINIQFNENVLTYAKIKYQLQANLLFTNVETSVSLYVNCEIQF